MTVDASDVIIRYHASPNSVKAEQRKPSERARAFSNSLASRLELTITAALLRRFSTMVESAAVRSWVSFMERDGRPVIIPSAPQSKK
jgi:hypothetical protein